MVTLAAVGVLVVIHGNHAPAARATAKTHQAVAASTAALAPDGTFMTLGGSPATIFALRGQPIVVWLVAGGCATCAASIPVVASHYAELNADGVRIVTLGLWGSFGSGRSGLMQLASFARAAGGNLSSPGWTWGVASQALSLSYDPSGTPDEYVLIDASGHIVYRNSVPVSTMDQLLAAAKTARQQ